MHSDPKQWTTFLMDTLIEVSPPPNQVHALKDEQREFAPPQEPAGFAPQSNPPITSSKGSKRKYHQPAHQGPQASTTKEMASANDRLPTDPLASPSAASLPDPWDKYQKYLSKYDETFVFAPKTLEVGSYHQDDFCYFAPTSEDIRDGPDHWLLFKFLTTQITNHVLMSRPLLLPQFGRVFRQFGYLYQRHFDEEREYNTVYITWFSGVAQKEDDYLVAFAARESYRFGFDEQEREVFPESQYVFFDANPFCHDNWANGYYQLVSPDHPNVLPYIMSTPSNVTHPEDANTVDDTNPIDANTSMDATQPEDANKSTVDDTNPIDANTSMDATQPEDANKSTVDDTNPIDANTSMDATQPEDANKGTVDITQPEDVEQHSQENAVPTVDPGGRRISSRVTGKVRCNIMGMNCPNKPMYGFCGATQPTRCKEHKETGQVPKSRMSPLKRKTASPKTPPQGSACKVPRGKKQRPITELSEHPHTPAEPKDDQKEDSMKKQARKSTPPAAGGG
jgi:hypothetical protein